MNVIRILMILPLLGGLSACSPGLARVKPWQRGNLAKPVMAPEREGLGATLAEHVYFSREASHGGDGVGGGGCGCN